LTRPRSQTYARGNVPISRSGRPRPPAGTTTLSAWDPFHNVLAFASKRRRVTRQHQCGYPPLRFARTFGGALGGARGGRNLSSSGGRGAVVHVLRRLAFSASFDTSRVSPAAIRHGERATALQWTARFQAVNRRDRGLGRAGAMAPQAGRRSQPPFRGDVAFAQALERDAAVPDADRKPPAAVTQRSRTRQKQPTAQRSSTSRAALRARESGVPLDLTCKPETTSRSTNTNDSTSAFVKERHDVVVRNTSGALVSLEVHQRSSAKFPRRRNLRLVGELEGRRRRRPHGKRRCNIELVKRTTRRRGGSLLRDVEISGPWSM
jgi:hypothetical protein